MGINYDDRLRDDEKELYNKLYDICDGYFLEVDQDFKAGIYRINQPVMLQAKVSGASNELERLQNGELVQVVECRINDGLVRCLVKEEKHYGWFTLKMYNDDLKKAVATKVGINPPISLNTTLRKKSLWQEE